MKEWNFEVYDGKTDPLSIIFNNKSISFSLSFHSLIQQNEYKFVELLFDTTNKYIGFRFYKEKLKDNWFKLGKWKNYKIYCESYLKLYRLKPYRKKKYIAIYNEEQKLWLVNAKWGDEE